MNALWKCAYIWTTMFLISGFITKKSALLNIKWNYILTPVIILFLIIFLKYTELKKHKNTVIILILMVMSYVMFSKDYYVSISLAMGICIQIITLLPSGKRMFMSISDLLDKFFINIRSKNLYKNKIVKEENAL